ncbi:response regulator [Dyella monticola]|uniref:Response regulator n=1 Tax=Dyella monticola TaxID=1927958 RepID=A0A370X1E7_9GAMM|nr:response regulator [Dyella monticola]RDS82233.1 response regulator [Dyella monticola]
MSVLIVDDDAVFRQALEQDLQRSGYAVCAASGLDSALNAMLLADHRVAIVDAHLPYREVKALISLFRRCAIPIVLLLEQDAATGSAKPIAFRGDITLIKPVGVVELRHCLACVIGQPQA